ncbi:MAG: hypothetical protein PQJ46_04935 [Spirochaetales bacterium]|nr:hypothetical protein [Spirochaetales bacterium]
MSDKTADSAEAKGVVKLWKKFEAKHPAIAQFIVFFILSNAVTLFQMILMPLLKGAFMHTPLIGVDFQIWPLGHNFDGSIYYIFNYPEGAVATGGGGGLAYFLAVQITLAIAQVINFFAQRNITFKSDGNILKAAFWYIVAYIVITISAAALQGVYKAPIYNLLINTWKMGGVGETIADFVTMIIYSAISFWVFFPIFRVIFKSSGDNESSAAE